jgi:hypothetical protein
MLQDELEKAIAAHGMWKARLRGALQSGKVDVKVEDARVDDKCEFGRWLRTGVTAEERASPHFRKATELHRDFHLSVGEVVKLVLLRRTADAQKELDAGAFLQRSSALTRELMAWRKAPPAEEAAVSIAAPRAAAALPVAAPRAAAAPPIAAVRAAAAPPVASAFVSQIEKAMAAHGMWKSRIRASIDTGRSELPLLTIRANDRCEFGKWLAGGELSAQDRSSPSFRKVDELHRQFHVATAHVVELALKGKKADAERESLPSSEFGRTSSELTKAMMEWRRVAR